MTFFFAIARRNEPKDRIYRSDLRKFADEYLPPYADSIIENMQNKKKYR